MKPLSLDLIDHCQQEVTTLATGWRVERRLDGQTFGWVDHNEDITVDSVLYRASLGLQPTSAHSTNDLSVDSLDVTVFLDVSTEQEIIAGIWDNALLTIFEYNWNAPPTAFDETMNVLRYGNVGQINRSNGLLKAEIRGMTQRLQARIGRPYSPTCTWRHAIWDVDAQTYVSSIECALNLTPLIYDGAVETLGTPPTLKIGAASLTAPPGVLKAGFFTFTSGANHNFTREVLSWQDGIITLDRHMPFAPDVGDTFKVVEGDDHTWQRCIQLGNWRNFGGFPHLPGQHAVIGLPANLV